MFGGVYSPYGAATFGKKVDIGGQMSPEDMLLAVAKGANPRQYIVMAPTLGYLIQRAEIRGGLLALQSAGAATGTSAASLKSKAHQSRADDEALVKAAGGGAHGRLASLKDAAASVNARVSKAGLTKAARAARGMYLLENAKGFTVLHSAAAVVGTVIFAPVGALIGGHISVTQAKIKKYTDAASREFKEDVAAYKSRAAAAQAKALQAQAAIMREGVQAPVLAPSTGASFTERAGAWWAGVPTWAKVVGGLALGGGAIYGASRLGKRGSSTGART